MNEAEQKLLDYLMKRVHWLLGQDDDLKHLIHSVYQSGMKDAAEVVLKADAILIPQQYFQERAHKTILEAANKAL